MTYEENSAMRYMTLGLNRKVSLVLLPIDDFTDRIIIGSNLRMFTKEGKKPSIRKEDGYHVFCDLAGDEAEICIEGPLYQEQILKLPIGQEELNIYQVRMVPGASYPIPQGATIVKGTLPAGSILRLFFTDQKRNCKLLYDYDPKSQGKELSLFQPYQMHLEGKTLCVSGKDKKMEFFRVFDQKGELCILEYPLSKAYQKLGTNVYPVYEAAVREDGSFYLPISHLPEEEKSVAVLRGTDGKEKVCEIALTAGRENWITRDMWREGK